MYRYLKDLNIDSTLSVAKWSQQGFKSIFVYLDITRYICTSWYNSYEKKVK